MHRGIMHVCISIYLSAEKAVSTRKGTEKHENERARFPRDEGKKAHAVVCTYTRAPQAIFLAGAGISSLVPVLFIVQPAYTCYYIIDRYTRGRPSDDRRNDKTLLAIIARVEVIQCRIYEAVRAVARPRDAQFHQLPRGKCCSESKHDRDVCGLYNFIY